MRRFLSCAECEFHTVDGCQKPYDGSSCPDVGFVGGKCCESCCYVVRYENKSILYCNLDFAWFDCPNGYKNPLGAEKVKEIRENYIRF